MSTEETLPPNFEERIIHILTHYPIISRTMLQGALGPQAKPVDWKPVLTRMIADGKVVELSEDTVLPNGRHHTYAKLHLPGIEVHGVAGAAD